MALSNPQSQPTEYLIAVNLGERGLGGLFTIESSLGPIVFAFTDRERYLSYGMLASKIAGDQLTAGLSVRATSREELKEIFRELGSAREITLIVDTDPAFGPLMAILRDYYG